MGRAIADQGRPSPGSNQFTRMFDSVRSVPLSKGGGLFVERSQLWMGEGQYNFSDKIKFADLIIGGNIKKYILSSEGTLFIDKVGSPIKINEWGIYGQASKRLFSEKLVLGVSGHTTRSI